MSSQKESKTFFWFAVLFLAMVFAVSIVLLGILVLGIKDLSKWLVDYGGLLGSVFAVVIASYTIKRQSQNTREQIEAQDKLTKRQISAQREMNEESVFKKKVEETYEIAFNLRLKVFMAKSFADVNSYREIGIFNSDVEKIIMLCELYKLTPKDLSDQYWEVSVKLLDRWSKEIDKIQDECTNIFDSPEFYRLGEFFISITDELIEELILKMKHGSAMSVDDIRIN